MTTTQHTTPARYTETEHMIERGWEALDDMSKKAYDAYGKHMLAIMRDVLHEFIADTVDASDIPRVADILALPGSNEESDMMCDLMEQSEEFNFSYGEDGDDHGVEPWCDWLYDNGPTVLRAAFEVSA